MSCHRQSGLPLWCAGGVGTFVNADYLSARFPRYVTCREPCNSTLSPAFKTAMPLHGGQLDPIDPLMTAAMGPSTSL